MKHHKSIDCFAILKRFLLRARLEFHEDFLLIKLSPSKFKLTRGLKSSLSSSEIKTIMMTMGERELSINLEDISNILVSTIRSNRKDIKDLYDSSEEIKYVYQVTLYLRNGFEIRLILTPNSYKRLKNYLEKHGIKTNKLK